MWNLDKMLIVAYEKVKISIQFVAASTGRMAKVSSMVPRHALV